MWLSGTYTVHFCKQVSAIHKLRKTSRVKDRSWTCYLHVLGVKLCSKWRTAVRLSFCNDSLLLVIPDLPASLCQRCLLQGWNRQHLHQPHAWTGRRCWHWAEATLPTLWWLEDALLPGLQCSQLRVPLQQGLALCLAPPPTPCTIPPFSPFCIRFKTSFSPICFGRYPEQTYLC